MSARVRRSAASRRLGADLLAIGQDLDAVYGPPGQVPDPGAQPLVREGAVSNPVPTPRAVPKASAESIELAAHLLGPEHCGRFVEVQRPRQPITRGGQQHPGEYRMPGPLAGRLVGYQAGTAAQGPNTGTPVRSLELFIQQGPHMTTATVSWADPVRISTTA